MPSPAEFGVFLDRFRQFQQEDHDKFAAFLGRVRSELPRLQAFFAKDPEQAACDMADRFWSLVQETLPVVENANRAIISKR